jgi:hypothetical protein
MFHPDLKLENFTHINKDISPLGFVGVPDALAGKYAPLFPEPVSVKTPPESEL